jgi:MGT family glycosyltransferase
MNIHSILPGSKVLFANFPGDGHFNPLTGLAMHLKSLGCDVRWYTSKKYEQKINKLGIPFYGLKKALDFASMPDIDAVFPDRKKYKGQVAKLKHDMINVFILRSPEYYEDILDIYEEFEFEVMVADITFGGIPFVREKMGIPVIGVDIIPLTETSRDLPPAGLGLTPSTGFFGKRKQDILRFIADKVLFAKPTRVMTEILGKYGIATGGSNLFDILIKKSTIVVQSGTPGFEYKRSDLSKHIHFIGPLLPYHPKKERLSWFDEKLNQYSRVVLVTQGTVETDVEKILVPTLEAFKNTDVLVVATTGGSQTEKLKNSYPEPNIIIEDFIPFEDEMPYADVYITNGGYGGVLLSIQNELPLVVAGVHEGKNEINARVGYFKLGINLKTENPTAAQLQKAVEEIFENPVYATNVSQLNKEFNEYDPNSLFADHVASLLRRSKRQLQAKQTLEESIY